MADRVGQQLGNYRLLRLLGEGGFAEVYLAEHVYLKTFAAIKVLHTRLAREDLEGFLSEARTIAALKHPHIVRVLDFGVEGGTPFLVMDYEAGGTLRERIPKGTPLSPAAILPMVQQVADALQHAHDCKLIHRDVKPENMLLDECEQIMLSDFGIATIAQSSRYQQTEGVAGTAAYMAPEQLRGRPRPASDQYSLGIVVYEWLGGTRPFQGSFAEMASQHLFVPPPPLSEKQPAISPAVEQVVLRALTKDPTERFASVQDFASAFEQASRGHQSTRVSPAAEVPPTLPAAAPPVTTPPKRSALEEPTPAEEPPATSGPFAPTRRVPPQLAEPATRRRTEPPAPPLASTVRAAPPGRPATPTPKWAQASEPPPLPPTFSGSLRRPAAPPAPLPAQPAAKQPWGKWLLVGVLVVVVVSGAWLGLRLAGNGSPASAGTTPTATMIPTATSRPALGTVKEFALPTANSGTRGITAGPDGNLWFTDYLSGKIGHITPGGSITEFALPSADSRPEGITAGPDGNLWFTESFSGKIGRITPGGTITEFVVRPVSSYLAQRPLSGAACPSPCPAGITAGPDGNLWFTEYEGNQIGRIMPAGSITEFPVPTARSGPSDIIAGPDGNLWFTEFYDNQIGRITPAGSITEFPVPTAGTPSGITAGPDGNLWFTAFNDNQIGRITPAGSITEFAPPTAGSFPNEITAGPDGNLWFTETSGNQIGRITPSETITEFALPTANSGPWGITSGPDGNLWFTESNGNQIGWISPGP